MLAARIQFMSARRRFGRDMIRGLHLMIFGLALTSCGDPQPQGYNSDLDNVIAADAAGFDSPPLPPATDGKPITVVSDPGVTYHLLESSKMPNGNLEIVTRRDGPSGTSFARREVDCGAMTFRYLGEGDSLADAQRDSPNIGSMAEAMSTSISGEVSRFACSQS